MKKSNLVFVVIAIAALVFYYLSLKTAKQAEKQSDDILKKFRAIDSGLQKKFEQVKRDSTSIGAIRKF